MVFADYKDKKLRESDIAAQEPGRRMKRPPTASQERFAEMIRKATGAKLPDEKTRQSLFIYIRDNKPEFDKKIREDGRCGGWNWLDTLDREDDAEMAECFDVW